MSKANAVAKDLRTPKYRMRVVKCRKMYRRKAKHPRSDYVA